jgi:hypothetical protein
MSSHLNTSASIPAWPFDVVGYDRDEWIRRYMSYGDYYTPAVRHDPGDPCNICEAIRDAMKEADDMGELAQRWQDCPGQGVVYAEGSRGGFAWSYTYTPPATWGIGTEARQAGDGRGFESYSEAVSAMHKWCISEGLAFALEES